MHRYRVIGSKLSLGPGTLVALTDDQAAGRAGRLVHRRADRYEVLASVEFKRGEIVGLDGRVSKAMAAVVADAAAEGGDADPDGRPTGNGPALAHRGRGRYDVVTADGRVLTEAPLSREAAEALIRSIGGADP